MRRDKVIQDLVMNIHFKYIKNEHKGDWRKISFDRLCQLFYDEIKEFQESITAGDLDNAIKEVADVALFGAYIVDVLKTLKQKEH